MQLRDMEAFLAVGRSGSLVAAVGHYPLTVSALSKAIRRVEREVGVELFDRRGSRLSLNHSGRKFAVRAEMIVALFREAKSLACEEQKRASRLAHESS